ncbi:hypothetical protein GEMRC1_010284 [Eukaryota sp. GEM-RC1]
MTVSPFGVVLSGRPVSVNDIQQLEPHRFLFQFENAASVKNVAVFLTGSVPLPPGTAASFYLSSPPFKDWKLLGAITNELPSAVFPLEWNNSVISDDSQFTAQIGIFVGNQDQITCEVVNRTMSEVQAKPGVNLTVDQIGQKMLKDFSNYVSSFAKDAPDGRTYVDVSVIDRWVQNFERRCRMNPKFWIS